MSLAHQVRLESHVAEGIILTGQPETLEPILENLVDNAISLSPTGARVLLRLERSGEQAIISV
jgi:signal transduction histidine kinase